MFQLGNKILPISSSKKCCICLEITKRYKKCPNDKCTDGIYCLTCLNKMTLDQKKRCSICRQETNFLKKIKIIVKKDNENKNINKRNKKKKCCPEFICILFFTICCLLLSFTVGLIIFSNGANISFVAKTCSPVILIIVGGIVLLLGGCCCSSFIYFLKEKLCKKF